MYKFHAFLLGLMITGYIASSQQPARFTLTGKVDTDTGTAVLAPLHDTAYYPGHRDRLTTTIKQGKFAFSDTILYPCAFSIHILAGTQLLYVSSFFIVDPGTQAVDCHMKVGREVLSPSNQSMQTYRDEILKSYEPVEHDFDELEKKYKPLRDAVTYRLPEQQAEEYRLVYDSLHEQRNALLLQYIRRHPGSYVAMWELINRFKRGYDTTFATMYSALSPTIRQTYTGQLLGERLARASTTGLGAVFPTLSLADSLNQPAKIPFPAFATNKYTLVDFWFSHCSACIGQFDALKKVYEKYSGKGFAIAGISTDGTALIPAWKSVIAEHQLPWQQYLDLGGVNAGRLSISVAPTNFLLDSTGKIIRRDVDIPELAYFLSTQLK